MNSIKNVPKNTIFRCPYCNTPLVWVASYALQCSCDTFPVIQNILYLKKDRQGIHKKAVRLLSKHRVRAATLLLLDSRRLANYLVVFAPFVPHFMMTKILELYDSSSRLWWKYLRNRGRRITHVLALGTISSIRPRDTVIDVGCGQGDFLQKIALWSGAGTVIGIDTCFFLLYVARNHIVSSDVLFVCADVENGLPLKSHYIDRAFFNDSFMYIHKTKVFRELNRVLTDSGEAFLTHVHNIGHNNIGQGKGISPTQINRLVSKRLYVGCLPDEWLCSSIMQNSPINYPKQFSKKDFRSYSYRISRAKTVKPVPINTHLQNYLKLFHIDFTEDINLQATRG